MTHSDLRFTARAFELLSKWKHPNSSNHFQVVLFQHEKSGTSQHTAEVLKYAAFTAANEKNEDSFVSQSGHRVSMLEAYFTLYLDRIDEICKELLELLPCHDGNNLEWRGVHWLYAFQYVLTALLDLKQWADEQKIPSKLDDVLQTTFATLLSNYCAVTRAMQDRDPNNFPGVIKFPEMEYDTPDKVVLGRFVNGFAHYLPKESMKCDEVLHALFWTLLHENKYLALRRKTGAYALMNHITHVAWQRWPIDARVEKLERSGRHFHEEPPREKA